MPALPVTEPEKPAERARPASLVVINPSGTRSRTAIDPLPFLLGRGAENHLVLRDNRISRNHARIFADNGDYIIEDLKSRHGLFLNGERVERHKLANSDLIDFGFPDSYRLTFQREDREIERLLDQIGASSRTAAPGPKSNLAKLRALVEVARALQTSLSTEDVLISVVDAALAVTGCERGFMLLRNGTELDVTVARDNQGAALPKSELRVPKSVIQRALRQRRELLSMTFDPAEISGMRPESTIATLELRSVVCVPLVHVRTGNVDETIVSSNLSDTVGVLYMDSRASAADLSAGNRELLQTLALEASTILENARLLEEERAKQRIEEELNVARCIQKDLLPRELPATGWLRVTGSSIPSQQVGGDYFDVRQIGDSGWAAVVADVSGKGVSSALLAALLQGAFLLASDGPLDIADMMQRINRFLNERTQGEKYATFFYCNIDRSGLMSWANAGHCAPFLVHNDGRVKALHTTGLPLGMLEGVTYQVEQTLLEPGDKLVLYSDGLTESENAENVFFDTQRLRDLLRAHASEGSAGIHTAILAAVEEFTDGGLISDDITAVVIEYCPDKPFDSL
ncbi:MAG TPA: SpoIIE family protein phosphatase [Bryobacteraceae bacterium]|nr:SpoIIE family protein phosphatase [Bryobacteraceae bacterium]